MNTKNVWLRRLGILVVILLLAVVPACSGGDEPEEQADEPAVEEPAEEPEEEPEEDLIDDDAELYGLFQRIGNLSEYSYNMAFYMSGVEQGTMSFYMKGEKMRMDGEADGQESLIIMDGEYLYMGEPGGQVMKFPVESQDATGTEGGAPSIESFTEGASEDNLTFVGYEEYEGFNCPVAEIVDAESGATIRMWLHPDYGFPLKLVQEGATEEESFTMLVTDFSVEDVSDDMFELPAGSDVMDMSDMLDGMTEGLEGMEDMLEGMEDMLPDMDE